VNLDQSRATVEGYAQDGGPVRAEIALGDGEVGMLRGGAQVGVKFSNGTLSGKFAPEFDSPTPVQPASAWFLGGMGVAASIVAGLLLLRFRLRGTAIGAEPRAAADRPRE
jgi:hypothetical protein